ncbi:hypothetical protein [Streptomyces sp. NPDC055189]
MTAAASAFVSSFAALGLPPYLAETLHQAVERRPIPGNAAGSGPVAPAPPSPATLILPALFRRSPRIRWSR